MLLFSQKKLKEENKKCNLKLEKQNQEMIKKQKKIIGTCLIEFGANHEETAWNDSNLGRFRTIPIVAYNTIKTLGNTAMLILVAKFPI